MEEKPGIILAYHLGRALQLTNILRDIDEDAAIGRLYLPREALQQAGILSTDPADVMAHPRLGQACEQVVARAREHFAEAERVMAQMRAQDRARAAHHGRAYKAILRRAGHARLGRAARAGEGVEAAPAPDDPALRVHLMPRTVHVIGAGLSGLAAAVRLASAGERVVVHEAAGQAGGRCRSYHDPQLDMVIDNGNHLLLSGNHAALAYLATIGAADRLVGPDAAEFAFVDLDDQRTLDAAHQ